MTKRTRALGTTMMHITFFTPVGRTKLICEQTSWGQPPIVYSDTQAEMAKSTEQQYPVAVKTTNISLDRHKKCFSLRKEKCATCWMKLCDGGWYKERPTVPFSSRQRQGHRLWPDPKFSRMRRELVFIFNQYDWRRSPLIKDFQIACY